MTRVLRVVEATLRGYRCAYDGYEEEPLGHGSVVVVREGRTAVFGVVVEIESGPEDPTRPMSPRGDDSQTGAAVMDDNPEIRPLLRTTVDVVVCGHVEGETFVPNLPPGPPPLLARVEPATAEEIVRAGSGARFLPLLAQAPECDDATIAAAVRCVMAALPAGERREYAVMAGKELARLMRAEPARLTSIIRSVSP